MMQSLASGTAIVVCAGLAVGATTAPVFAQDHYSDESPYKPSPGTPLHGGWGHGGGRMNFGHGGFGRFGSGTAIGIGIGIATMMANGSPAQVQTQSDTHRPPSQKPRPKAAAAKPPPPPPKPPAPTRTLASRERPAPAGETRFRRGEVLVSTSPAVAPATVLGVLQRHRLVEVEATHIALTDETLRLWRIPDTREVGTVVAELGGEEALRSVQPNYVYAPQAEAAAAGQYSLGRLNVDASLDLATSEPIRVAVIDTAIDVQHPDLKGAVEFYLRRARRRRRGTCSRPWNVDSRRHRGSRRAQGGCAIGANLVRPGARPR